MPRIHFHIGPHKTGSTAIQEALRASQDALAKDFNLFVVHDPILKSVTKALRAADWNSAKNGLHELARRCHKQPGDCIISSEDLAGDLPGRGANSKRPYPRLWKNISTIREVFSDFDCRFYFFVRDPEIWMRSAYVQALKYRSKFASFDQYRDFLISEDLWDKVIEKSKNNLRDKFIDIRYREDNFSSTEALLRSILGKNANLDRVPLDLRPNSAPSDAVVRTLEVINRSSASQDAKRNARAFLTGPVWVSTEEAPVEGAPVWPPELRKPDWLSPEMNGLWGRVRGRVYEQSQPNLLPDLDCDLSELRFQTVVAPEKFPEGGRASMENQREILRFRFNGLPETALVFGLAISYLRRSTRHTAHASYIYQRLWMEEYPLLLGVLPTRWLISAFQTFMEHGATSAQRELGAAAYFYANMLKIYEGERALEGLQPDSLYPENTPAAQSGMPSLDRYELGGTDLLLNTNALLLERATSDSTAGRVVQEFLVRLKGAHSVFTRHDRSRKARGISNPQFANCWSFFEEP